MILVGGLERFEHMSVSGYHRTKTGTSRIQHGPVRFHGSRVHDSEHTYTMSQSPAPAIGPSSKPPTSSTSCSNFTVIFEKTLKEYKRKTKEDLTAHPLAAQFQACNSTADILAVLQDQVDQFSQSRNSDERLQRWLNPTINVLYAFSDTLGAGISFVNI